MATKEQTTVRQRIAALRAAARRYRRYLVALAFVVGLVLAAGVAISSVREATAMNKGSSADTYRYLDASFPKQDFEATAGDNLVTAQAPRGALPAGTIMHVTTVDSQDVTDAVMSAAPGVYEQISAVDVVFIDPNGQEIQPLVPITVTMTNINGPAEGSSVVLHVDDQGNATVVAESDAPNPADEVAFEANSFSVYIMAVKKLQQTMTASDGRTYEISVTYTEDAGIPDGAELVVREVTENDSNFSQVFNRAKDAATSEYDDATVASARFFDISIMKDGATLEPLAPVEVNIVLTTGVQATETTSVVHLTNSRKVEVVDAAIAPADAEAETGVDATFTTESFSIFGVIEMKIEKDVLASDGNNYHITVTCGSDAGVPAGATLAVEEILPPQEGTDAAPTPYETYVAQVESALGWEFGSTTYARLFDIKIVDKNGNKVEIAAPVDVRIELADKSDDESTTTQVVHFADDADVPDVVWDATVDGDAVSFAAESFSVYAIEEEDHEPATIEVETVTDPSDIEEGEAYYLSVTRGTSNNYYFKKSLNSKSCFELSTNDVTAADTWYFESTGNGTYLIYTLAENSQGEEVPHYITNTSGNLAGLTTSQSSATVFEISKSSDSKFFLKIQGQNKWLQYSNGGVGIRFYTDNNNPGNACVTLTIADSCKMKKDPYGLDGKAYGIAYHNDTTTSAALGLEATDASHLAAEDLSMKPNVLTNDGVLLVTEDSDISKWTLESVEEDKYYLKSGNKYLVVDGTSVSLSDTPDPEKSLVRAVPGTGSNSGKWHFTVNDYALNYTSSGFNAKKSSEVTTWLNLADDSVLDNSDFTLYTAQKVSVSDTEKVPDGAQVIIYTRVWNDTKKRYEFFAVDSDGSLIPCYDAGDNIEWFGTKVNDALWEFTEYREPDGSLNYFYELQNVQYGDYIAPQVHSDQVLSDATIGINLNGRRYGESYTTIIAWDENNYSYSGLKVEDGHVVPCALADADDFYFAIMVPTSEDPDAPQTTTVATVDSNAYGIEMKMIDFNSDKDKDRNPHQTEVMGTADGGKGLLSTNLSEEGYPTVLSNQKALSELFDADEMQSANHLFIQSIYNESGYFEYNSTENFAHFNEDGTFTVYDQIGAITGNSEHKVTREHGQFMPYNDISAEKGFAIDANGNIITNQTSVTATELPDSNPRKGEKLYLIGDNNVAHNDSTGNGVDYFFGMEMSASFTQTASGLDDWGHDIIFEFSGDDDFWLYVDGELVIDLGGVHQAQVGTVNFRTGVITSSNGNSTLYDTFKSNYAARGLSETEIAEKLDEIFEKNADGKYVFKDYSTHTMRMFYMERGAGASNLHMRFNLAAVKPGTFLLSKKLAGEGVDPANDLIEFPYQIYYMSKSDSDYHLLSEKDDEDNYNVTYKGSTANVRFADSFTPAGGTESYQNVFFLKPGQTAQVALPEDVVDYYVVECGVNPSIYEEVTANGTTVNDTTNDITTQNMVGNTARHDYKTAADTLENRSQVDYVNHVAEGAMRELNITKRLYDSDGVTPLHYPENDTTFSFRLYLGNESADDEDLPLANLYSYYVKDGDGYYCKWDATQGKFVSLGITDYATLKAHLDTLTNAEKESIVFKTSQNGSISKIPADHTVEVRDLIVDTKYMVEERDYEIPKGYTLRLSDGYTRMDTDPRVMQYDPYSNTIKAGETPEIEVRNQKGWGLTVEKVWTDKDFMEDHDPIFFAVYVKSGNPEVETLVESSVRQLDAEPSGNTNPSVYYFFGNLQNVQFDKYLAYEVTLTGSYTVDDDGVVTLGEGATVTPISDGGTLTVGGKPYGGRNQDGYQYSVTYERGEQTTHNENVRTDTVTNSRPGIKLYKTKWDYETPLAGAAFTLKDGKGVDVALDKYTSRSSDGLITIAYVSPGTYYLTETSTPKGYVVLDAPMKIVVGDDGKVSVSDVDANLYTLVQATENNMATITIRNRTTELEVKKVDPNTGALADVHFALYRQVTDAQGNPRKDYEPMTGFADLVTDNEGVVPLVNMKELNAGTYYLDETQPAEEYGPLSDDICFTIGNDGTVTINSGGDSSWITRAEKDGHVAYTMTIPNSKMAKVEFIKVDIANPDTVVLEGAVFDLYEVVDGEQADQPMMSGLVSGADGVLVYTDEATYTSQRVFELPIGVYHLVETKAPAGYNLKATAVEITVTSEGVSYDEGTTLSSSKKGVSYDETTLVYLLKVSNTGGYELPESGGRGTVVYTLAGTMMVAAGAMLYILRRRELI